MSPPKARQVDPVVLKTLIKSDEAGGVAVRYWPVWQGGAQSEYIDTKTRNQPWMLGHGEWVVSLEGRGSVAVSHLALLPIEGEQGPGYGRPQ